MDILKIIKDAGIVGAGGAGFPTHIKYKAVFDKLVINAAECEPLLEKDLYLIETNADRIFNALDRLLEDFPGVTVYFATKEKYNNVLAVLKPYIEKNPRLELTLLGDYYPAGDEFEIVYQVTGKSIPPGGLPLDLGCVVSNVETLYNIGCALDGKPVTQKYLTINGEVDKPGIYRVAIGTGFRELLDHAGIRIGDPAIIEGGPMMGEYVDDSEVVKKTTAGIIVAEKEHPMMKLRLLSIEQNLRIAASACTQCTFCTELCSRYLLGHPLEPHKIMRSVSHSSYSELAILSSALICSECGVCELYACPMGLSPRTINKHLKEILQNNGVKWEGQEGTTEPRAEKAWRYVPGDRIKTRLRLTEYDNFDIKSIHQYISPEKVVLKLLQHSGTPSVPVVEVGDEVKAGQLIAEYPAGELGANLHSSIDGTVKSIDKNAITIAK
ncbi:4Fe-4S dicluster domain-containing protein [bacterium]|nr:4Fe-4S dicluster domain-containing protein [bacterium]